MIASLIRDLGFTPERVIAEAGPRGIAIAAREGSRSLVTIVRGAVDGAVLRERPGWDLPLEDARAVETSDGTFTVIVEALITGIPSVDLRWPDGAAPAFAVELAERMARAHAGGAVVGPLHAALVFVEPHAMGLAGVAQRPVRAELGSAKPDGEPRLFPVSSMTPAEVLGSQPDAADDAFRLAAMVWRFRHGEDRLAGLSVAEQLGILAGTDAEAAGHAGAGDPADTLDVLLERMLDPAGADRPAVEDLVRELRRPPVAPSRG